VILQAFMSRRSILIDTGAGVKAVGSRYLRDTRPRARVSHAQPPPLPMNRRRRRRGGRAVAAGPEGRRAETPVVIAGRGVLRNPSNSEVAKLPGHLESLPISQEDKDKIAHRNAEILLGL
jgi:thioredoxin reductase (NADPH)